MIVLPHLGEGNDGTVLRICESILADKTIVPITRINGFTFNPELLNHKEAVLIEFVEYGWQAELEKTGNHFFGHNTKDFKEYFPGEEWGKFDEWVTGLEKVIYFKRELLHWDNSIGAFPIDYPSWSNPWPIQSEEEFNARKITLFNYWGRSHEARLRLHANTWLEGSKKGWDVCDNIYYFSGWMKNENEASNGKFVTLNIPHYGRIDLSNLLSISNMSKMSIAMPGAGRKTFRETGEVLNNSILVCHENNLAYSYQLEHGRNCIKFNELGKELEAIEEAMQRTDLYQIYCEGVKTAEKYRIDNYVSQYLLPIINA